MTSKPSHGWSMRNQGGFKRSTRVKAVYKAPERPDAGLTVQQAASKGYNIRTRCLDHHCLHEKTDFAANVVVDFPALADLTLAEIAAQVRCTKCGRTGTASMSYDRADAGIR